MPRSWQNATSAPSIEPSQHRRSRPWAMVLRQILIKLVGDRHRRACIVGINGAECEEPVEMCRRHALERGLVKKVALIADHGCDCGRRRPAQSLFVRLSAFL